MLPHVEQADLFRVDGHIVCALNTKQLWQFFMAAMLMKMMFELVFFRASRSPSQKNSLLLPQLVHLLHIIGFNSPILL